MPNPRIVTMSFFKNGEFVAKYENVSLFGDGSFHVKQDGKLSKGTTYQALTSDGQVASVVVCHVNSLETCFDQNKFVGDIDNPNVAKAKKLADEWYRGYCDIDAYNRNLLAFLAKKIQSLLDEKAS